MKKYVGSLICLGLAMASSHAQDTPGGLPPGPLLSPVPEFAQWTVQYTYAKKTAETDAGDQTSSNDDSSTDNLGMGKTDHMTVTKTKNEVDEVIVDTAGKRLERWSDGKLEMIKMPNREAPIINTLAAPNPLNVNLGNIGFDGFDWIDASNYVGPQKLNGKDCLQFKKDDQTAYVDAATHLPVHYENSQEQRDFSFAPPPQEMMPVPDEVDQRMAKINALMQKEGALGSRP